ncbi:HNH endonuclease [Leeia sp. TBRC 13508]|uniref:HNH endonuclease n=1 Tax=Leeia speluncae TaxID=2884804 RepID=A0ABS8D7T9_9NEIS|nr:HNH endonuclease [Leeia speluncae]MCB6184274.1 HNH endonuclease [Leeia speluncae]
MPAAPRKPCTYPGCRTLVAVGQSRCDDHPHMNRFADRGRGSSASRGYGWQWAKLRRQVMERDCGLCQVCQSAGYTMPATAVDHILPKSSGGTDALSNLQAICDSCHKSKTAKEAANGRTGG